LVVYREVLELFKMEGKCGLVTGASSGIGKATAFLLARRGAKVFMLSRNRERGRVACDDIKRLTGNRDVTFIPADLSSPKSIRMFVSEFRKRSNRLGLLFNCAGILYFKKVITPLGFESMFAVNYLGLFLLTNLLYEPLKNASTSRVITVSGRAHKPHIIEGFRGGKIDFENLNGEKRFNFVRAAKQAVLARIIFTYEIARRWAKSGISACTLCPGLTKTNIVKNLPLFIKFFTTLRYIMPDTQTPEQAAEHLLKLAYEPKVEKINGKYFEGSKKGLFEARSSEESYNIETAQRLWNVSENLLGEHFDYQ